MRPIVSTDPSKLDVDFIHQFLTNAYWAKGRTREQVQKCIENSLNFGLYVDGKQIGYARVTTDYVVLAYLMDVFIDEEYRGLGYANILLTEIMNHPQLKDIQNWRLGTDDAHGLYEKFGFRRMSNPERMMERVKVNF